MVCVVFGFLIGVAGVLAWGGVASVVLVVTVEVETVEAVSLRMRVIAMFVVLSAETEKPLEGTLASPKTCCLRHFQRLL